MNQDETPSTTLGYEEPVVVSFGAHQLRIDREPGVAAPNYYTDTVLEVLAIWPEVPAAVLDVGSGTGILAIAAALRWPTAAVEGIDIDPAAVQLSERNVASNGVDAARCRMVVAAAGTYRPGREFDLIIANPPQIPVPPGDASIAGAGPDGTSVALETIDLAARAVSSEGKLLLALADFVPARVVEERARNSGLLLELHREVPQLAGPFTLAHRDWIERGDYRFRDGNGGPEFMLRLLVGRRQ